MHAAYLNKRELARLDAFQAKSLRRILRIPHSYISRVSNKSVLEKASADQLSRTLLQRQLRLLAHVARKPDDDPVRQCVFEPSSAKLKPFGGKRCRGRPRLTWPNVVHRHAIAIAGDSDNLKHLLADNPAARAVWDALVQRHCADQQP